MTTPTPPRRAILVFLLLAVTLGVFGRTVTFGFVNLDDDLYVTKNPHVRAGWTTEGIVWAFTATHAANWHPLTWLSLLLDAEVAGSHPALFHATNLLFHLANVLLLFFVLDRMTGLSGRSGFVAALFAVHPLHVESVAWIAERKDVLSTLFWFLTLLAYHRYTAGRTPSRYGLVVVTFSLGLMAKPMLVTLPLVLLLLDYWPLGRLGRATWRALVREKLPLLALSAASSVVTFLVQWRAGAVGSILGLPLRARVGHALVAYVQYLSRTLWPRGLAVFYPHPGDRLRVAAVLGSALLLVVLTIVAVRLARRRPYVAVGWLWYLCTLVPVIGLVQVGMQSTADRYTYVPLVGLFVIAAWGTADLVTNTRLLAVAAGLTICALTAAAYVQVGTWRSSRALFEHAVTVTSHNSLALSALGSALVREGEIEQAISHFHEALRIFPGFVEAHNGLGLALFRQGKVDEAVAHWRDAIRLDPSSVDAHTNLGLARLREGKVEDAAAEFREALRNDPDRATARGYLAGALIHEGRIQEAIGQAREALRIDPGFAGAHHNLGLALLQQGKLEEAGEHFEAAVRADPGYVDSRLSLGVVLARQGRLEEAEFQFSEALRLDPGSDKARRNLEATRRKKGDR